MIRFLQRLQRGTVILIGLIVATYVASYVISVALGVVASGVDSTGEILVKSAVIAVPIMIVAGTVIAIPALIIVAIAEFRGWRSLVIHFSAGGVVGLLTGLAVTGTSEDALLGMLGGLGAGVIGSAVYWAIAGRNAGRLQSPLQREEEHGQQPH